MLLTQIAKSLGLPELVVLAISRKASHAYKMYAIPKRGGGSRIIHHPSKELKALQRWLVYNIIDGWPVHSTAKAYRPNLSILNNAQEHIQSRFLLRMDFKDFFPSITKEDVKAYLKNSRIIAGQNWTLADFELFAALVCRDGKLTIGAPSSPSVSNALCYNLDQDINSLAQAREITYTRYADDLFFSTRQPDVLKQVPALVSEALRHLPYPSKLVVNESKTRHSSKKGLRRITGLVLRSDDEIGIGRRRKRYIRGLIHRFDALDAPERRRLAGLLGFARSIEPDFINALIVKFGIERITEVQQP